MSIGSLCSATIPADRLAVVFFSCMLFSACSESPVNLLEKNSSFACGHNCSVNDAAASAAPSNEKKVHLEVEPLNGLAEIFYNVDSKLLDNGLILHSSNQIKGHISAAESYLARDSESKSPDSPGFFSDISAIAQANRSPGALQLPVLKAQVNSDADFSLTLLSEQNYTIIINPHGLYERAPFFFDSQQLGTEQSIVIDAALKRKTLKGRVNIQSIDIKSATAKTDPLLSARVMQGSRLVSARSDLAQDGSFSLEIADPLFMPTESMPLMLVIEPKSQESALPRLKKILDLEQKQNDIDLGGIDIGKIGPAFKATFEVYGADDSPIGKSYIYMTAKIGKGEAQIKKQVNDKGITEITEIYDGVYDIAIIPPFESKFALQVLRSVTLSSDQNNHFAIDLQKREMLNSKVIDYTEKPVSGAHIELSRIGKVGDFATEDIFQDMLFKLTAVTNEEGTICQRRFGFDTSKDNQCTALSLDPGKYLAHIIPPVGSMLAHSYMSFDFPLEKNIGFTLAKPRLVSGRILEVDAKSPLKNAFITIYEAQSPSFNPLMKNQHILGNAFTDQNGFFNVFVSP
jgi:hypothetical protein